MQISDSVLTYTTACFRANRWTDCSSSSS